MSTVLGWVAFAASVSVFVVLPLGIAVGRLLRRRRLEMTAPPSPGTRPCGNPRCPRCWTASR